MKKIVDSNPAPETPKTETVTNEPTKMTASPGGAQTPSKSKDNTLLIVGVIAIILLIGFFIWKNSQNSKTTNGTQPTA